MVAFELARRWLTTHVSTRIRIGLVMMRKKRNIG
jgi:hypothetical protein